MQMSVFEFKIKDDHVYMPEVLPSKKKCYYISFVSRDNPEFEYRFFHFFFSFFSSLLTLFYHFYWIHDSLRIYKGNHWILSFIAIKAKIIEKCLVSFVELHFSMILSSTHILWQRPEEQVFRHIPKCAEQRDLTPDLRITTQARYREAVAPSDGCR